MSGTEDSFRRMVEAATQNLERHPRGQRARVIWFSLEGHVRLCLNGLLLVASVAGVIASFYRGPGLAFLLSVAFWALLGAWTWLVGAGPAPVGMVLRFRDSPELHRLVKGCAREVGATLPDSIVLSPAPVVVIQEWCRWGSWGGRTSALVVGLPLLLLMSSDQVRALLLVALARRSPRVDAWLPWVQFAREKWLFAAPRRDGIRFVFFKRYVNRFAAHAVPWLHRCLLHADGLAVRSTEPNLLAQALLAEAVYQRFVGERVLADLLQPGADSATPPRLLRQLADRTREGPSEEDAHLFRRAALNTMSGVLDPEPSLRQRLERLGVPEPDVLRPSQSAASHLFGARLFELMAAFDEQWRAEAEQVWAFLVESAKVAGAEFDQVRAQPDPHPSATELSQHLTLALTAGREKEADAIAEQILSINSGDAEALLLCGLRQLERGEHAGVAQVKRALKTQPLMTPVGGAALQAYYARAGEPDQARKWQRRAERFVEQLEHAERERLDLDQVPFVEHQLQESHAEQIAVVVAQEPTVLRAYLVRLDVKYLPEIPSDMLFVRFELPWFTLEANVNGKAAEKLHAQLPEPKPDCTPIIPGYGGGALEKRLQAVPGAVLYERRRKV